MSRRRASARQASPAPRPSAATLRARALVVDTSVAASVTERMSSSSCAQACTSTLRVILENRLFVLMPPPLLSEWTRHRSRYGVKWLARMRDAGCVIDTPAPNVGWKSDALSVLEEHERAAFEKDRVVIDPAIHRGRRVISRDDRLRAIVTRLAKHDHRLGKIHWFHPEQNETLGWLLSYCPDEPGAQCGAANPAVR